MTDTAVATADGAAATEVEFDVSGMTCGSCAARVEKTLSRQPGVSGAAMNFATERALVRFDANLVAPGDLIVAVEKAGYGLTPSEPAGAGDDYPDDAVQALWLRRVVVAWPLAMAVLVLSLFFMDEPWAR